MAEQRESIRRAFDARAPHYDDSAMHRSVASAVAGFAELGQVSTVLDVATGTGLVLRALSERIPEGRLVGIDISPGMLAVARAALPSAEWVEADAAALPLPESSVDLLTCVTALHIIPGVAAAAAEWRRVLRPGGRVLTATFLQPSGADAVDRTSGPPDPERSYPRDHGPYGSVEALDRTFSEHGFAVQRHIAWSDDTDTVLIAELARSEP